MPNLQQLYKRSGVAFAFGMEKSSGQALRRVTGKRIAHTAIGSCPPHFPPRS
jgi:hypothetical protein